jgi:zinc protease
MQLIKKIMTGMGILTLTLVSGCSKDKDSLSIQYEKYTLPNGLQVVLHLDKSDPIVSTAIMYHVGSSREEKGKTGFAHLFEHMLFQESENIPQDQFFRKIQNAGGTLNGFTTNDITTYFEVVPKNALELILWMESDRMGYFINTVTQKAFAVQQNVVQNEKRQGVDNQPYGHRDYVIDKNIFPPDHPYSWQVIGEMEDLRNATAEDVKSFYRKFYGPNNATLVLAGDFHPDSAKALISKYFGEIGKRGEVSLRPPMNVTLDTTKRVFHEDNFANMPEITMVWPVVEQYNKDAYALTYLAKILSEGKKAPLYKVLIKEKQLTSEITSYNDTYELAGKFLISMKANEGHSLDELEKGVYEAFDRFEKEGITHQDVDRVRAMIETDFYSGLNSVFNKSLQLAFYNTFKNDPGYIEKDLAGYKAVTLEDVKMAYTKYIQGKPCVITSFVPKGKTNLIVSNSVPANVMEEKIEEAVQVAIEQGEGTDSIPKTPSLIDRSKEPVPGPDPSVTLPRIWKSELKDGIEVKGIEQSELPLVTFNVVLDGGFFLDDTAKPGVANMVAVLLKEGTRTKTPEQLEEEIELLGANIWINANLEEIVINVNTLSRNYEKTLALVEEMLMEPRWDSEQFSLAKIRTINELTQQAAEPNYIASNTMNRLLYGEQHIFSRNRKGTPASVNAITLDDLKQYYEKNFSPTLARFNIAGNVTQDQVIASLASLEQKWQAKQVAFPQYAIPAPQDKPSLYFVDVPGSKQSVIQAGYLALSRKDPDYYPATVMNYKFGGSFSGILNMILREEKGFTYGARSYFNELKNPASFIASSSVRSDATLESLTIFKTEMEKYRMGISEANLEFTKNALLKSNTRRFETLNSLLGMLSSIGKYDLPADYILQEEEIVRTMSQDRLKALAEKYMVPDRMVYLIVGDAATQLKDIEKAGLGKPEVIRN